MQVPASRLLTFFAVFFWFFSVSPSADAGDSVPCQECFPIETLSQPLQIKAKALLTLLFDSDSLYTLVGGIKPITEIDDQDLAALNIDQAELTAILATFHCTSRLRVISGPRHSILVTRTDRVQEVLRSHLDLFEKLEISEDTELERIVQKTEDFLKVPEKRPVSSYALGLLYGYPDHAALFFYKASLAEKLTQFGVSRRFITFPTVRRDLPFTYAVAENYQDTQDDIRLNLFIQSIFDLYIRQKERKQENIQIDIISLLRTWYDNGSNQCKPENTSNLKS